MAGSLGAAPVLSTPDTHILEEEPSSTSTGSVNESERALCDEQLEVRYEIARTVKAIREKKWRRVALQFPDEMLVHSARVYQLLARGLGLGLGLGPGGGAKHWEERLTSLDISSPSNGHGHPPDDHDGTGAGTGTAAAATPVKLTILADTSYGSCCVDEIAAEHVDADAVVHYGRSCLSPTARLPVLYVYTKLDLDYTAAVKAFQAAFPDDDDDDNHHHYHQRQRSEKVIVTADVPYSHHVQKLCAQLSDLGYTNVFAADIIHNPASPIPNRTIPPSLLPSSTSSSPLDRTSLRDWHLFHISDPPTSLLLTLSSNMASIQVFPTTTTTSSARASATNETPMTSRLLRRRYALVTSLSTVPVWGILINTLSVKNYLSMVSHVQKSIAEAGKKSYLFVVGKINVAKVSNFSEVGGWVVIGCWESSLIDSKEFYRPIITPFELELALQPDDQRQWTGEWRADFQSVFANKTTTTRRKSLDEGHSDHNNNQENVEDNDVNASSDSSEESDEAPEFDLRTGKYVSRSRPMKVKRGKAATATAAVTATGSSSSTSLTKRPKAGAIIAVNGIPSPAAQYLQEKRTWRGLGSDFEIKYDDDDDGDYGDRDDNRNKKGHEEEQEEQGGLIEQGRRGVASGYTVVGEEEDQSEYR